MQGEASSREATASAMSCQWPGAQRNAHLGGMQGAAAATRSALTSLEPEVPLVCSQVLVKYQGDSSVEARTLLAV